MMDRRVLLASALSLLVGVTVSTPVGAGWQEAVEAHKRGDYATALREVRPVAETGDARAQALLGSMYAEGQGVPQDYAEAAKWYRRAAEQGDARAQFQLGAMYHLGQGVPLEYVTAHKWLNLAASRFPAGQERDSIVMLRDSVARKMRPDQIAEAQRQARAWQPKPEKR